MPAPSRQNAARRQLDLAGQWSGREHHSRLSYPLPQKLNATRYAHRKAEPTLAIYDSADYDAPMLHVSDEEIENLINGCRAVLRGTY